MLIALWRTWRMKKPATGRRPLQPNRLWLETLERRDLLTTFAPLYTLIPSADSATPMTVSAPSGNGPSQIAQAYGFNQIRFKNGTVAGNGSGQTIAIVDAYSDPNITSDLHQFDQAFGLSDPPSFKIVNQNGGSALPAADSGWDTEIALDVEWAHAMAPGANILLVEADSASENDLFSAVQYAANQPGVSVVSMSWGGGEFPSETYFDSTFTTPAGHAGVAFIASSGDSGAPSSYPADSPNVLAVGGTTLRTNGGAWASETAWNDSGGGISAFEAKPSYQNALVTQSTTQRTSPDVSYDANPYTGYAVYNSFDTPSGAPWEQVGGTSAGAPQWAALVAIADQGRALNGQNSLDGGSQLLPALYQLPSSDFHDITSGGSFGASYYAAGTGYDLVTGRGSPFADRIVAALAGAPSSGGGGSTISPPPAVSPPTITTPANPPAPANPPSPPPAPPDPFAEVAQYALDIVQGYETWNADLFFTGLHDYQTLLANSPAIGASLQTALFVDILSDLNYSKSR